MREFFFVGVCSVFDEEGYDMWEDQGSSWLFLGDTCTGWQNCYGRRKKDEERLGFETCSLQWLARTLRFVDVSGNGAVGRSGPRGPVQVGSVLWRQC